MKAAFVSSCFSRISIIAILCATPTPVLAQAADAAPPAAASPPTPPANPAPAAAPEGSSPQTAPPTPPAPAPVAQPAPAPVAQPAPAPVAQPAPAPAPVAQPAPAPAGQPVAAAAAATPAGPGQPPPAPKELPIGERTGFYFQAALGAGFVSVKDEYEGAFTGTETVKGTGSLASLLFGGGVGAGFVLGAGIESISGTFDYEDDWGSETGETTQAEVDVSGGTASFFVQKYLGPVFLRVQIGGMWGGAEEEDRDYGGFMLGGGVGADFLVSESWSLGGVAALRRTASSYDDDDGYSGDYTMTVSSLQFSATYY